MAVKFVTVTSKLVPFLLPNIDTDQIIPAQYVNATGKEALANALFANRKAASPDFVLNRPEMQGRSIMLCGPNFGCGSSREAAAWAIAAGGFRAMIGTTFNDTFARNCMQNCLPTVHLQQAAFDAIAAAYAADFELAVTIDLKANTVSASKRGLVFPTGIDKFSAELMINGIDEFAYLLDRISLIRNFEARQVTP